MAKGQLLRWRYRLEELLMRAATAGLPLLPWEWLRGAAWMLGTAVWAVDARGRRTTMANLGMAFPSKTVKEHRKICRQCYQGFARSFAELFWAKNVRSEALEKYVTVTFASPAVRHALETGAIIATPHAGNFEWLSVAAGHLGITCLIVAENFKNPALTGIFRQLREQSGQMITPQEGAGVRMFKHLRRGGRVALLTDLSAPPEQSATVIRCFGRATCVTMSHAALAHRSGRPIIPTITIPQPDGRYELRFMEPIHVGTAEEVTAATQATWDSFERIIREQPAMWLWIYKHWRYLPKNEEAARYPFYAHGSKKFDKLAADIPTTPQPESPLA